MTQIQIIMAGREVQYILVNGRVREIQGTPNLNQIRMKMAGREKQFFREKGRVREI